MKKKKLFIIDAFALIFRAYYAIPPLATKDGKVVNAVFGFLSGLFTVLNKYKPEYICVAFDSEKPTFRKEMYDEYKAHRKAPPDDFKPQIPIILDMLKTLNIKTYAVPGYEADDIIGTICSKKSVDNKDTISYIFTGDLDTLQLVDDNTHVITFKKGMSEIFEYDETEVSKKYEGLAVSDIINLKAIKGDASDNIPGVPGIGEVGAIKLVKAFKNLEGIYQNLDDASVIKPAMKKKLEENKELAFLSRELSTIKLDVPMDFDLEETRFVPYDQNEITQKLLALEFKSLIAKLPVLDGVNLLSDGAEKIHVAAHQMKNEGRQYTLINDEKSLQELVGALSQQKEFVFDTETTSQNALDATLLGISISFKEGQAYYISIKNKEGDGLFKGVVNHERWLEHLRPLFENQSIKKIGHNVKYDMEVLGNYGISIKGELFDTMIAAYLCSAGERAYSLDTLCAQEFSFTKIAYESLVGEGKNKIDLIDVSLVRLCEYSCEDADYTYRLYKLFQKRLKEQELDELSQHIEMPLIPVLVDMERAGITLNVDIIHTLDKEAQKEITQLEKKIYELAGKEFNIDSPLQLQEILFVTLGLPTVGIAKTKSGFSTAASELEKLFDAHKIVPLISQYREFAKMKSTYLESLPQLISKDARIHTSYNQTVAATGRLSSTNPNLQNIPTRTSWGNRIREAFIAPEGFSLVSADYSQIELRLTADASGDENMQRIFREGKDIHTSTAAIIHGIPESQVTKEIRSSAKEINFGIIYGLGPYGLAQRTEMSRDEAKKFIEQYFEKFPGVKKYLESSIATAREQGF
ncbi:DNA polymerase I, partial [Candidatus Falkowbacteria bacterium]|nr:DNA polymerase I [Candidatus Falkowbacteria bacterium]